MFEKVFNQMRKNLTKYRYAKIFYKKFKSTENFYSSIMLNK